MRSKGARIMNLVQKTMPVREPIDPALISLIGFAKMGEEASKPGATALGSGFSGISTAAQTYLADQLARQKEKGLNPNLDIFIDIENHNQL